MRVHITLVGTFRHLCMDVPIQNWIYHSTFQVLHESNHTSKHRRYQTPRMEYMSGICFLIAALPFRETTYTARALPAPYTPHIRECYQTNFLNQIRGHQCCCRNRTYMNHWQQTYIRGEGSEFTWGALLLCVPLQFANDVQQRTVELRMLSHLP